MTRKILIPVLFFILISCKDDDVFTPTTIKALTGMSLTGIAGETSDPLVVQVLDQGGRPMENIEVNFSVVSGSGTVSSSTTATDANGAAFSYVIFGKSKDDVVIHASSPSIADVVTITYRISSSRASKITIISGNNQEGVGGRQLKDEIVVSVSDDFNNKAAGAPVKFVLTQGNGVLSETSSVTDDNGTARTKFTLSSDRAENVIKVMTSGDTISLSAMSWLPSQLSPPVKTDHGVHLEWEKTSNTGFLSYSLQRTTSQYYPIFIEIANFPDIATTSFDDNTVNPGTQYQYKMVVKVKSAVELVSEIHLFDAGNYIAYTGTVGGIAIDQVRKKVYISVTYRNEIQVFDLESSLLLESIYIGSMPMGINLSHDNSTLMVALSGSGDVAFLDLETRQIRSVDVEAALGFPTVYSVIEAAPGKVFVTADPHDRGDAYLTRIQTDDNYSVQRCSAFTTRGESVMEADYGNRLIFLRGGLQLVDPTSLASLGFSGSTNATRGVYNPSTDEMYLNNAVIGLAPLTVKRSFQSKDGVGISPDGSMVHYVDGSFITSQLISSNATVTQVPGPLHSDFVLQVQVSEDNKHLVLLCIIGGGNYYVFFVNRPAS